MVNVVWDVVVLVVVTGRLVGMLVVDGLLVFSEDISTLVAIVGGRTVP